MACEIRPIAAADIEQVLLLYGPFIEDTVITFEEAVPTLADFTERVRRITAWFPWLVCVAEDGTILGYAYAAPHRGRAAYRWNAELSIYVGPKAQRSGIGKALYSCLLALLREQGYRTAYGIITVPNPQSIRFHEAFGFTSCGTLPQAGYKHGRWHDVAILEKKLLKAAAQPKEPISLLSVPFETVEALLQENSRICRNFLPK